MNRVSSKLASPPPSAHRIRVRIPHLVNATTRMEIRDGKRFYAGAEEKSTQRAAVEFVELGERTIRLEMPPRTCAQGHRLELRIELAAPDESITFHGEGIIERVEASNGRPDLVTIELSNHANAKWIDIKKHFVQRQASVADLFERLKGGGS